MNEKALLFGETKSLVGIVTDPSGRPAPVAFVILNAGIVHRVGPNRIHVKLARRLARAGFVAMRFDFSGIGDSKPRVDGKPFSLAAMEEIRQAFDYLESSRGIGRFVLVGICSGADAALGAGAIEPRIVGAVAIEGHAIPTATYLLRQYRARLLNPRSWLRLFSGRSELWTLLSRTSKGPRAQKKTKETKVRQPATTPPRRRILDAIRAFDARGARLLLVYSVGSPSWCFYRSHLRKRLPKPREGGSLSLRTVRGADHVFTDPAVQEELLGAIGDWARELPFRVDSPMPEAEAPRAEHFVPAGS